tara:strand:+ start:270 stop:527 length:258 start_codon:yes stop_codon:yes gene_type:complete
MAMSDKELKKIKAMMPSGASLQALKNLVKRKKKNKSDRHPGTGSKAAAKSITSKLKNMYPVSNKDVAFLKKAKAKKTKVNKAKLR